MNKSTASTRVPFGAPASLAVQPYFGNSPRLGGINGSGLSSVRLTLDARAHVPFGVRISGADMVEGTALGPAARGRPV